MEFLQEIDAQLGGLGLVIGAGVIGFLMILTMLVMILRQPEDPLNKLKRTSANPGRQDKGQRLRQSEGNEQLQKFAKFLEPEDVAELSAKQLMLRQDISRAMRCGCSILPRWLWAWLAFLAVLFTSTFWVAAKV